MPKVYPSRHTVPRDGATTPDQEPSRNFWWERLRTSRRTFVVYSMTATLTAAARQFFLRGRVGPAAPRAVAPAARPQPSPWTPLPLKPPDLPSAVQQRDWRLANLPLVYRGESPLISGRVAGQDGARFHGVIAKVRVPQVTPGTKLREANQGHPVTATVGCGLIDGTARNIQICGVLCDPANENVTQITSVAGGAPGSALNTTGAPPKPGDVVYVAYCFGWARDDTGTREDPFSWEQRWFVFDSQGRKLGSSLMIMDQGEPAPRYPRVFAGSLTGVTTHGDDLNLAGTLLSVGDVLVADREILMPTVAAGSNGATPVPDVTLQHLLGGKNKGGWKRLEELPGREDVTWVSADGRSSLVPTPAADGGFTVVSRARSGERISPPQLGSPNGLPRSFAPSHAPSARRVTAAETARPGPRMEASGLTRRGPNSG